MHILILSVLLLATIPFYRCWRQNRLIRQGRTPEQLYEPLGHGLGSYVFGTSLVVLSYCLLGSFAQSFSGSYAWLASGGTVLAILAITWITTTLWWSAVVSLMRPRTA